MAAPISSNPSDNIMSETGSYVLSSPTSHQIWESIFDLSTISLIAVIILLSLLSLSFILHLRFRTRTAPLFHRFNSLWNVRFLLVIMIMFWAFNEIIRLPVFARSYFFTLNQKSDFCKAQIVLSLGIFEPGFLIILLFLLRVSIRKRNTHSNSSFAVFFAGACFPLAALQIFAVFFSSPEKINISPVFRRSSIILRDEFEQEVLVCTYPLLSTIFFGAYAILYLFGFIFSCWKVCLVVINKMLRVRIFCLASTVLLCLPIQILFMGLSPFWGPDDLQYDGVNLVVFAAVFLCAVVGECVLVIFPIADTLSASGYCSRSMSMSMSGDQSSQELT